MTHLFSDVSAFRRDPLAFVLTLGQKSEQAFVRMNLGLNPYYLVTDPNYLKQVLKAETDVIDKGMLVNKLRPIVGDSSLVTSGPEQRRRRSAMHSRMSRATVDPLVPSLCATIRQTAAALARENSFVANEVTGTLALSLIAIVLFGQNVLEPGDRQALLEAIRIAESELEDDMFRAFPRSPKRYLERRRQLAKAKKIMSVVVGRVRVKACDTSVVRQLEELGLSDEEIRDEILTMLIAGHHTTGAAATWILYHMAIDDKLADKVADEAASISDNHGELRPNLLKTANISYSLVREVLRFHPSIWWFARETKQDVTIAGQHIKKGSSLVISPWQMHKDKRFWRNPDEFRLDRDYGTHAYIPFGFGSRACVGMGVALLKLQLFSLEFATAYRLSSTNAEQSLKPKASVTLVPPKIMLSLKPRDVSDTSVIAA